MIEELKALVEELCDSLEVEVRERWGYDERLKRQYDRDMEVVIRARETLPKFLSALSAVPVMKEALESIYGAENNDSAWAYVQEIARQALAALEPKP
jgi:hypothetical protein